ncbi:MAG: DHH family phosphoesterase [Lachnospiraceae bacterium]|nr:DHH family phosphoesterase [Lachnospiraceae bacterium]
MKRKLKLKGALRAYLCWPLYMTILLCVLDGCLYLVDKRSFAIGVCFTLLYLMLALSMYLMKRPLIVRDMVRFAASYGQVQRKLLKELSIPYAILDSDGHMLWGNDEFRDILDSEHVVKRSIASVFPDITRDVLPKDENDTVCHVKLEECNYKVVLRRVMSPDFEEDVTWSFDSEASEGASPSALIAMYLYDETEIMQLQKENQDQKLITGLLYIDNYEEALESIDQVRRSLLIALVDRKINKYMQEIDAIIKKLEKDKYIFVFQQKYLSQLQTNKFSILEDVRAVNIGNEMSVTISIGLGVNMDSCTRSYEAARAAIDLALGRGGDQAVVRENDKIYYYGGKSVQVEKNTRVKARVKAHALKEFVEAKDKVVIMGHSIGDVDSFGAAIGVYRIAKTLNKRAYIVINDITTSVRPMINRFLSNPDYEEDMFLKSAQALEVVDANTLLVVVDVNRPSITECSELLNKTRTVVVLDHHRQTGEAIEGAVLSYIEPYASSACEMVAEILQYIGEGLKIRQAEADAMYAGIMIDTNNFLTKTGVRTFEAAAFLRRNGADVTRIRKAFRTEMVEFKVKSRAIANVEVFLDYYALTECESEGVESPTITGAQVANELLNVTNIRASFVFTKYNGKIFVSARSIDEVNVQVVMEKLGGGGHMSMAGAQFTDCSVEEAMQKVKDVLAAMTQEGDI